MKPVLMIHEVRDWMLDLPLEKYTLTFDDALYSQYYYFDYFNKLDTEKIIFVSSNILADNNQSTEFLDCQAAHEKAAVGNTEDYMTLAQIKELMQLPNVRIGGHSHFHQDITKINGLMNQVNHIKNDTKLMIQWFEQNLRFIPTMFCFPHNNNLHGIYQEILKTYGFTEFYGYGIMPIELLASV